MSSPDAFARSLAQQLRDERSDLLTSAKVHLRRTAPFLRDDEHDHLARRAVSHVTRAGALEEWLGDPAVKEVMVNADGAVFIEHEAGLHQVGSLPASETRLIIERVLLPLSRQVDRLHPVVDARLDDGSRVCVVVPPASPLGPCLTIRRFVVRDVSLEHFADEATSARVRRLVDERVNLVVSGRASAGKTTLVNALCRLIPRHERLVTVEDTIELDPGLVNVVRLESQPPSIEGAGQVSLQQLVRAALRLRPDRLVVGEVRGAEVLDMLEAMTTGHDGSLTTCHANSARDAVDRLAALVVRHHHGWSITDARNLVRLAIGAVIHVERDVTGIRKIAEIHPVSPS